MRVLKHPILGDLDLSDMVTITVDGKPVQARRGLPIAAELLASGISVLRKTAKRGENRGVFCCIGRCTDCVMTVNGLPNVRTCVTPVEAGMVIETQEGLGKWGVKSS